MVHTCKCEKQVCITHLNDPSQSKTARLRLLIIPALMISRGKKQLEAQLVIGPLSQKVAPI